MSDHLANLILALGIFAVGFASIGPNILAIIGTSMQRGRRAGLRLAAGVGLGSGLWAVLAVSGLTAFLAAWAEAVTAVKVAGALYLAWLALKAFRSAARASADLSTPAALGDRLLLQGVVIQMSNPKAALHWIAIVAIGLGADAPLWSGLTLIVACALISLLGHCAYALIFSSAPVIALYRRGRRWIEAGLGVFFSLAAWKLATFRT